MACGPLLLVAVIDPGPHQLRTHPTHPYTLTPTIVLRQTAEANPSDTPTPPKLYPDRYK